jgi:hypothetical protein
MAQRAFMNPRRAVSRLEEAGEETQMIIQHQDVAFDTNKIGHGGRD